MKIAILSDTRRPTLSDGHHGLGKTVHDIASGLMERGHEVTLYGGLGSCLEGGTTIAHEDEMERAIELSHDPALTKHDVILDSSHQHTLAMMIDSPPVINRMGDMETRWKPTNAVVETAWMNEQFPDAKVIKKGIRTSDNTSVSFSSPDKYLLYMSELIGWKGFDAALKIQRETYYEVRFAGVVSLPVAGYQIENYQGVLTGDPKWDLLQSAYCLLHPSRKDAAPRLPLEAAACGIPTLCLEEGGGTVDHVEHGVSGFICKDVDDMIRTLPFVRHLDAVLIRDWLHSTHRFEVMIDGYEMVLEQALEGEIW